MSGIEVTDPYVERLLEGAGFMAARVQLKLDAEFPRFTQSLLEMVYPHYLAPTPSMAIVQIHPDKDDPGLGGGARTVPRGTTLHAMATEDATACEFRTAHDVTLLPVEVVSASYFSFAPDLPLSTLSIAQRIKGGLRIRLKTTAGLQFEQANVDRLCFYLGGRDDVANKLLELCLATGLGVLVRPSAARPQDVRLLPASAYSRSASAIRKRCSRSASARSRATAWFRSIFRSRSGTASSNCGGSLRASSGCRTRSSSW